MRIFLISADIVMGLILGMFLYVVISRIWDVFQNPVAASVIFTASVLLVLFRRPNGSLARREDEQGGR